MPAPAGGLQAACTVTVARAQCPWSEPESDAGRRRGLAALTRTRAVTRVTVTLATVSNCQVQPVLAAIEQSGNDDDDRSIWLPIGRDSGLRLKMIQCTDGKQLGSDGPRHLTLLWR